MSKVIITGASGFVGKNLAHYLESSDFHVLGISLRSPNWEDGLPDEAQAIIHLAGKAHDTSNTSFENEYFEINTELTKKLYNVFLGSGIRDFIYFSSVKAAADSVDGILDENHKPNPQTPYGKSKWMAEEYLLAKDLPDGKRLFIIRPCMIHGAGNKGNLNLFYKIVQKGIPWPLAAFENKRSFLGIDNLNFLINQILINKHIPSGIYNFADDESISTNELFKIIAKAGNKKGKLIYIPKNMISLAAKLGDKLGLTLNSERLKKLTESYEVSNAKIKKALGIPNLPNAAQEGLEKTIKSFKNKL